MTTGSVRVFQLAGTEQYNDGEILNSTTKNSIDQEEGKKL